LFLYVADEWKRGMDNGNRGKNTETGDNGWSWGANKLAKYDERSGRESPRERESARARARMMRGQEERARDRERATERARAYVGMSGRESTRERARARERERKREGRGREREHGGTHSINPLLTLSKPSTCTLCPRPKPTT
jgi:hypothetical protein